MSDSRKLLGDRIRHMRRKSDLSQEKLAEMLGIDPNSVSRIECGVHYPSLETLEKVASTLDVEMRDFFLFSDEETAEEMRTFLIKMASELSVGELREVVRCVRKVLFQAD